MVRLKDLSYSGLNDYFTSMKEPKFRVKQVFGWLCSGVESFEQMTNLSKALRERLSKEAVITVPQMAAKRESKNDGTIKYLWKLSDGQVIESVLMKYEHGLTICISTQVGCRMGCGFCASTLGGLVRNLTAGEILDQVIFVQKDIGARISNIVLMGIGEPLDNYDEVLTFLRNVNHPDGLNIGYRHISLSTCGVVPKLYDLAQEDLPITLSISLHAPNNALRQQMMPINKAYPIEELMKGLKAYQKKTGRRITFEYAMVHGLNDTKECATELAARIKGFLCHVNLIPVNAVEEREVMTRKSLKGAVFAFQKALESKGINATIRRELGSDIEAACGQLRKHYERDNTKQ